MNQFSPQQLDDKIHAFTKRKWKEREIDDEQYYIERVEPKRGGTLFPTIRLQY